MTPYTLIEKIREEFSYLLTKDGWAEEDSNPMKYYLNEAIANALAKERGFDD